jgi:hypothetical protein
VRGFFPAYRSEQPASARSACGAPEGREAGVFDPVQLHHRIHLAVNRTPRPGLPVLNLVRRPAWRRLEDGALESVAIVGQLVPDGRTSRDLPQVSKRLKQQAPPQVASDLTTVELYHPISREPTRKPGQLRRIQEVALRIHGEHPAVGVWNRVPVPWPQSHVLLAGVSMRPDDEPVDQSVLTQPGQNVLNHTVNAGGLDRAWMDSAIKVESFVGRAVDDD